MEYVVEFCAKVAIKIGGGLCSCTSNLLDHHNNLEKHLEDLKTQVTKLNCQKSDVLAGINGVKKLEQAKNWIVEVEKINKATVDIKTKVQNVKWHKRACLGGRICETKELVSELLNEGGGFFDEVKGNAETKQETSIHERAKNVTHIGLSAEEGAILKTKDKNQRMKFSQIDIGGGSSDDGGGDRDVTKTIGISANGNGTQLILEGGTLDMEYGPIKL